MIDHVPLCYCPPGYSGDPKIECQKLECEVDPDCRDDQICHLNKCVDPCLVDNPCATNAICSAQNHAAICRCPQGLVGDPYERCLTVECQINQDCASNKACIQSKCVDPCLINKVCAPTAICSVINHVEACKCPSGFIGDPFVLCSPEKDPIPELQDVECEVDSDCPSGRACLDNKCRNPCYSLSPCDDTAVCSVVDTVPFRTMICSCREGWIPDSDRSCVPIPNPVPPGCVKDDECPNNAACINRVCKDPCDCGEGAECFIESHKPICRCPPGFVGNPQIKCTPIGCQSDPECEDRETCVEGNCINPCLIEDPCGNNAECYPQSHQANCRCREGYEGDPFVGCVVIGCRTDPECPTNKACENRKCIDPCKINNPCAPTNSECLVQNHIAQCRCHIGFTGDPYRECLPIPPPECVEDKDCPNEHVCIDEKCVDACKELSPCKHPATCRVVNTEPIRYGHSSNFFCFPFSTLFHLDSKLLFIARYIRLYVL